jgi:uncharacterized repeat protein (TIGR01451 family)
MSVLLPASAAKTVAATLRRALEGASLRLVTLTLSVGCGAAAHAAASIPTEGLQALATSGSVNVLVEYEASAVDTEAAGLRRKGERFDSDEVTALRAKRYKSLKDAADAALPKGDLDDLADYSHLPMRFKRVRSAAALKALAGQSGVRAIYLDRVFHKVSAVNLTQIAQPTAAVVGYTGAGTTVAVLDDGIDYTNSAFGNCTAPGVPAATCMVSVSRTVGSGTTDNTHGTNVSAIVAGVAPGARIAMLNVFSGTSAYLSSITSAMSWVIANKATYNFVAINLSLGDGGLYTSQCTSGNPYYNAVTSARNAGITVVAAAGNEAYTTGLSMPACTPGIVSVGAVYAANYGTIGWGANLCTDTAATIDKVTCFSDSASYLTMLAPGALITAGGITEGGTSQAAPHVAGAVAVLRAAFPSESLANTLTRLTSSSVQITDPRNGQIKPRLDLVTAARPANDNFGVRSLLSGSSGTATGVNLLGSAESGEPAVASGSSERTVWWRWVAPVAGQVSVHTHGSGFDTALAVYQGSAVGALTQLAANDNDGSAGSASGLLFQAQAGVEYEIAVDGMAGAQGAVALAWALNSSAKVNVAVSSLSGPTQPELGSVSTYTATVSNAGPQTATHVVLTLSLPTGVSFASGDAGCTSAGSTVVCALGNLDAGGTATVSVNLLWGASSAQALTASVSTDVPDSVASDNSFSTQVVAVNSTDSADTPTLPQWAAMAMGSLMLWMMLRRQAA